MGAHQSWCTYGSERTPCRSWISPFTLWVLGSEPLCLSSKFLHLWPIWKLSSQPLCHRCSYHFHCLQHKPLDLTRHFIFYFKISVWYSLILLPSPPVPPQPTLCSFSQKKKQTTKIKIQNKKTKKSPNKMMIMITILIIIKAAYKNP